MLQDSHNLAPKSAFAGGFGVSMPKRVRITRLSVLAGVVLVHGLIVLVLSRHRPDKASSQEERAIKVIILTSPPEEKVKKQVEEKPLQPEPEKPPVPLETNPVSKPDRPDEGILENEGDGTKEDEKVPNKNINENVNNNENANNKGAFLVRPGNGAAGAYARFNQGFQCARLTLAAQYMPCSQGRVNLMQDMGKKIAEVSEHFEGVGNQFTEGKQLFGIDPAPPGSTSPLTTKTPTGAPILGENFAKIPPKHPDPSFGD